MDVSRRSVERKCTDKVPDHAPASTYRSVALNTRGCRDRSAQWRECPEILPCHLPPAPSSSFAALPRARACLASPRTCHLPNSTCVPTRQAVRLSGPGSECLCDLPSRFVVRDHRSTQGSTTVLAAYQSVNQRGQPVPQPTSRPKVAKVGNGTTRFGLLFGRGTVSPRLPAVCTPSCSSPDWK